jgi:hypothetical protein
VMERCATMLCCYWVRDCTICHHILAALEPIQPEDSGLLGCDTVSMRERLLTFQTIVFPHLIATSMMKATQSFEHPRSTNPATHHHVPEDSNLKKTTDRTSNIAITQPPTKLVLWDFWSAQNSWLIKLTTQVSQGYAVVQLVEALCYKPEGRRFDSQWCPCNFSLS